MYSRRDRLFYHILQTDKQIKGHDLNNPEFAPKRYKYRRARFQNVPDSLDSLADKLGPFYKTDYTVETPTGKLLAATREMGKSEKGREIVGNDFEVDPLSLETVRFLVYKLGVKFGIRTYAEDIRDSSLFVGRN